MIGENFATVDSLIHHLDPRIKIVVVVLFSVVVAISTRFVVLVSALAMGVCVTWLGRLPIKEVLRRLVPVNMLIIFLWFFLPFTVEGESLFSVGPLVGTNDLSCTGPTDVVLANDVNCGCRHKHGQIMAGPG